MTYLRFGKIPENEKSINYLKLTYDQQERLACGNYKVPEDAMELGVSVFEIDENGLPVLSNLQLVSSLIERIDAQTYEVEGEEIAKGNDGEPLIVNIKVIKERKISKEELINHCIEVMTKNFKNVAGQFNCNKCNLHSFRNECKMNVKTGEKVSIWEETKGSDWEVIEPYQSYTLCGLEFSNPVDTFSTKLGIAR